MEIGGTILLIIINVLCAISGIGGGGIKAPLIMFFHYFSAKEAMALSSFAIVTSSTVRFFWNFKERNPIKPQCSAVDYTLIMVMMP